MGVAQAMQDSGHVRLAPGGPELGFPSAAGVGGESLQAVQFLGGELGIGHFENSGVMPGGDTAGAVGDDQAAKAWAAVVCIPSMWSTACWAKLAAWKMARGVLLIMALQLRRYAM